MCWVFLVKKGIVSSTLIHLTSGFLPIFHGCNDPSLTLHKVTDELGCLSQPLSPLNNIILAVCLLGSLGYILGKCYS